MSTAYWQKFNTGGSDPIQRVKEYFKDSLFTDSIIATIRKFPMEFESIHGGTFDYYYGKMNSGRYSRIYDYGSSAYYGRYDDDVYVKDGKYVALLRADYLSFDPEKPDYLIFVLQRFNIKSILDIE